MCQLNLYLVSKNVPTEEIICIFEKYNLNINVNNYFKHDDLSERYKFYSTNNHCDCGSIISRLQEENINSFDAYKMKKRNDDIEKLNKMKILKATDDFKDYERKYAVFTSQMNRLSEVLDRFRKPLGDYETEEREKIFALNLQDEEETKMILEILNPKLDEMYDELENKIEYRNALKDYEDFQKKFIDFITENMDLNDSMHCNITDFEKTITEYDFSDFLDEFNNLKNAYREILKLEDEICIYPFWQDGEAFEIKDKRQVVIQNLKIEDLIFLPYRNLLKIINKCGYNESTTQYS